MAILTDRQIFDEIDNGTIKIEPYDPACVGTNSIDIHLGKHMLIYHDNIPREIMCALLSKDIKINDLERLVTNYLPIQLDAKKENAFTRFEIPETGILLSPSILYLGVTLEYTETHAHVPFLEGKSSTGRLGIDIHATAGKGDVGFCNHWTLEISCKHPVRVYAGMPIGQMIYFPIDGEVVTSYKSKPSAKYNQRSDKPQPSSMWKNKF